MWWTPALHRKRDKVEQATINLVEHFIADFRRKELLRVGQRIGLVLGLERSFTRIDKRAVSYF